MVKNSPANAGDTASVPDLRRPHTPRSKRAHEPQLLSLGADTVGAQVPESLCSVAREACGLQLERGPAHAAREKSSSNRDPTQPKVNKQQQERHLR